MLKNTFASLPSSPAARSPGFHVPHVLALPLSTPALRGRIQTARLCQSWAGPRRSLSTRSEKQTAAPQRPAATAPCQRRLEARCHRRCRSTKASTQAPTRRDLRPAWHLRSGSPRRIAPLPAYPARGSAARRHGNAWSVRGPHAEPCLQLTCKACTPRSNIRLA